MSTYNFDVATNLLIRIRFAQSTSRGPYQKFVYFFLFYIFLNPIKSLYISSIISATAA